jgi:integrase/recombinase XerC
LWGIDINADIIPSLCSQMSPHRVRHSALDVTGGNITKVQKLSGYADPRTLMISDDNRNKDLWEMSELLTGMLKDSDK